MIVDTSTIYLRAASAWVISPAVIVSGHEILDGDGQITAR